VRKNKKKEKSRETAHTSSKKKKKKGLRLDAFETKGRDEKITCKSDNDEEWEREARTLA